MVDILLKLKLLREEIDNTTLIFKKSIFLNEEIKPYNSNDISIYKETEIQPYNFEYNQLNPNFPESYSLCYYNKDNKNNEILDELTNKITILNNNLNQEFKVYNELKNDSENDNRELEKTINNKIIQLNDEINIVNRKLIGEQVIFNNNLKKEIIDIEKQIEDNYKIIFELIKKRTEIINKLF